MFTSLNDEDFDKDSIILIYKLIFGTTMWSKNPQRTQQFIDEAGE